MKLASTSLKTRVPCSACGAMVVVRPGLRWTKMQCPKCRAVTDLPNPRIAESVQEASPRSERASGTPLERPDSARFEARISILEARLILVEQELASLRMPQDVEPARDRQPEPLRNAPREAHFPAVTGDANGHEAHPEQNGKSGTENGNAARLNLPPGAAYWTAIQMAQAGRSLCDQPESELPPVRATGNHSGIAMPPHANGAGTALASTSASGVLEPAPAPEKAIQEEAPQKAASPDRMVEKLAEMAPGKIAIRVKEGDTEAILFGESLGLLFIKAGWTVTTFEARPIPPEEQNLTLAISGNFPFPKKASAIHAALSAAGLELDFGIDPASESSIPTIIVPRRPVKENAPVIEEAPQASPESGSQGNGNGTKINDDPESQRPDS